MGVRDDIIAATSEMSTQTQKWVELVLQRPAEPVALMFESIASRRETLSSHRRRAGQMGEAGETALAEINTQLDELDELSEIVRAL